MKQNKIEVIMGDGSETPKAVKEAVERRIAEMPLEYPELSRVEREVLSDESVVWNVVGINDKVFCRDEKSALALHAAINEAIQNYCV